MYEGNINWILAIASLLAGIGIGAIGYHLLNANVARNQKVRQRLAETELELSQVRDTLNDHFISVTQLVKGIQRQSQELEQQVVQGAERLSDDPRLKRQLTDQGDAASDESAQEDTAETLETPRDYADGNRGTLSEDFGLHQSNEAEQQPAPPARY
ncbi:YhcB family protein [Halomonas sp. GXIMD04776]|uniref:YhcB family protein n=1 Tax=Halomonas sp. GXIMD04776 TaxID=3415605 RepID=UPI003C8A97FE